MLVENKLKVEDIVKATCRITEGGSTHSGDSSAVMPDPQYIHAEPGDEGTIVHIGDSGLPTVLFKRTGTATIVGLAEVKKTKSE